MMLRRSFGTIHEGHLPEGISLEEYYYNNLDLVFFESKGYTAGAFALEVGEATNRMHIQFYVEHSRKRPSTLAKDFGLSTPAVFDRVKDAQGAWNYCTGTGSHKGKEAISRFEFGSPKLHGDTHRADLKLMVSLIIDGSHPVEILKEYPYAYCVHRRRIWDLWRDIKYGVEESEMIGGR